LKLSSYQPAYLLVLGGVVRVFLHSASKISLTRQKIRASSETADHLQHCMVALAQFSDLYDQISETIHRYNALNWESQ